jgi:hypothetical protein
VRPRRTSLPGEIFSCRLCTIEAWHYEGPVWLIWSGSEDQGMTCCRV